MLLLNSAVAFALLCPARPFSCHLHSPATSSCPLRGCGSGSGAWGCPELSHRADVQTDLWDVGFLVLPFVLASGMGCRDIKGWGGMDSITPACSPGCFMLKTRTKTCTNHPGCLRNHQISAFYFCSDSLGEKSPAPAHSQEGWKHPQSLQSPRLEQVDPQLGCGEMLQPPTKSHRKQMLELELGFLPWELPCAFGSGFCPQFTQEAVSFLFFSDTPGKKTPAPVWVDVLENTTHRPAPAMDASPRRRWFPWLPLPCQWLPAKGLRASRGGSPASPRG